MLDKTIPDQQIFEAIFEHHHAVMLLIEPESGSIIRANSAALNYYGYNRETLENMNIEQINVLDREEVEAGRLLAAKEKRNYFIFPHRLQTGEIRQVEVHSSPILFEEHPVLFSVIHDVTDRQRALSKLAQSEDRYHSLVEHIANGVAVFRPEEGDFVLLDINKTGERLIRQSRASLLGRKASHLFPYFHGTGLLSELNRVHRTGQPHEMPKFHYQEERFDLWLRNYLYPLPNGEIVVILEDLTDATELQQALDRSRSTLADILDTMDAVVYVTDIESYELLYVNAHTRQLTGALAGDICWQVLQEGLSEPCDFCINPIVLRNREKGAEPHRWEYFNPKIERWFSFIDSAISWSDGRTVRLVVGYDITYLKKTELALRESEERLNALVDLYSKAPEMAEKDILAFAAERVRTITRSELGYLLFVSDDGEMLRFAGCSNATHSEDDALFRPDYPVAEVSLWDDAVKQCRTVIQNDMPTDAAAFRLMGLFPHHMVVPVIEKRSARILLGVADKQQRYEEGSLRQIKLIGETVWQLINRKRAEQQLQQSAIVFETTREAVIITDAKARILAVNRAFTEITGYTQHEVIGDRPNILKSGRYDQAFYQQMWHKIKTEGQWHGEIWNRRKSGEIYPEWLSINSVLDDRGEAINYIGVFSDISHIKHSEEQLHHLAHYDPLTDLPNRLQLSNQLASSIGRANRLDHRLALLFIDLDHFKTINDSLGHPTGDRVLQMASERLRNRLRKQDFLARLGGDEFVILLEDCKRLDDAAYVAQDVIDAMQKPFILEGVQEIYLGSSIGISLYPEDGRESVELIRNADTAMYRAKEEGRNTYRFYTEAMTLAASERLVMETRLRRAIEQHELCVYYQPLLLVSTQEIIGFEALVRWQSPEDGLILPHSFIPVAEESGLISAIGDWVLEHACCEVMGWRRSGVEPGILSVNLSSRQFQNSMLTEKISRIMQHSGIRAEQLEFEITESVLMALTDTTVNNLNRLEALGVQLAIDDFGTGYSSLAYLKRFNIDKLKIDQAFIQGVPDDSSDVEITSTIIAMAKNLHIQVLAEGVENQQQLVFLQNQACDQFQGYYLAEPLPGDEALQLLREMHKPSPQIGAY